MVWSKQYSPPNSIFWIISNTESEGYDICGLYFSMAETLLKPIILKKAFVCGWIMHNKTGTSI